MSDFIRTISGTEFFLDARPEDIHISDIAHSLSMVCRWAGHLPAFYSVALHSIYVSFTVRPEHALAALLHDASEAYLGDMAKPFKKSMPDYQAAENKLMSAIAQRFGFEFPLSDEVHHADAAAMYAESVYFGRHADIPMVIPPVPITWWNFSWGEEMPMRSVREMFLTRFNVLTQNEKTTITNCPPYPRHFQFL